MTVVYSLRVSVKFYPKMKAFALAFVLLVCLASIASARIPPYGKCYNWKRCSWYRRCPWGKYCDYRYGHSGVCCSRYGSGYGGGHGGYYPGGHGGYYPGGHGGYYKRNDYY
ncbi:uncharacterized protein LOC144625401 [Crassostrea virginica]